MGDVQCELAQKECQVGMGWDDAVGGGGHPADKMTTDTRRPHSTCDGWHDEAAAAIRCGARPSLVAPASVALTEKSKSGATASSRCTCALPSVTAPTHRPAARKEPTQGKTSAKRWAPV